MSNKKQSSIDYLIEMISYTSKDTYNAMGNSCFFEQAKELHKKEIIYAYEVGFSDGWNDVKYDKPKYSDSEQYYKNTYETDN